MDGDEVFRDQFGLTEAQMVSTKKEGAQIRAVNTFSRQDMLHSAIVALKQQASFLEKIANELLEPTSTDITLNPEEAVNFYLGIEGIRALSQRWISSAEVRKLRKLEETRF
jgi:hypothetical protein